MRTNYSQGWYAIKNPEKYAGSKRPRYRSSWELYFMNWADNSSSVLKWASEPLRIPYRDPFTGKVTTYVPDFLIQYVDKNGKQHVEIIEIKPEKQQVYEKVGNNQMNRMQYIKNQAKWQAAQAFCYTKGLFFRVVNQHDMYHGTQTTPKRKGR